MDNNKIVERKDVTVQNMFKIYENDPRYRGIITWDAEYLITGWKHAPRKRDRRHEKR